MKISEETLKMLLDKISKLELRLTTLESEIQVMQINITRTPPIYSGYQPLPDGYAYSNPQPPKER